MSVGLIFFNKYIMNTSIPVINLEEDSDLSIFNSFAKNTLTEGEVIHFASRQKATYAYLKKISRVHLRRTFFGVFNTVGWCIILLAVALAYFSMWWLLLSIPGIPLAAFYSFLYLKVPKGCHKFDGCFIITNKHAIFLSGPETYLGGSFKDVANGMRNNSYLTSSSFKIGPDMVTKFEENSNGTAMVDFDKKYLSHGTVPAGQCAWQYVTRAKEALAILEQLSLK